MKNIWRCRLSKTRTARQTDKEILIITKTLETKVKKKIQFTASKLKVIEQEELQEATNNKREQDKGLLLFLLSLEEHQLKR